MKILLQDKKFILSLITLSLILTFVVPVIAATTSIHIVKYANDGTTILAEKTLTIQEMESTLPVQGDGSTHYYLQGPVFVDNPDETVEQQLRWNPDEDTNVQDKDMGAVKGTDVKDLCNLVGGMSPGETLKIKASDGMTKEFAYTNVYSPSARQGPMVITWYKDGTYPDSGYEEGMRLLFFADTSVNPWGTHVLGNYDWHESADPKYWYYYMNGAEKYPTTTGLSVKYVSEIQIYSTKPPGSSSSPASYSGGGGAGLPVSGAAAPVNPDLYGYKGKKVNTFKTGTLNGSVRLFYETVSQPVIVNNRIREFNLSVDLPPGSNITLARMYLYISGSHNVQSRKGVIPSFYATLNKEELKPDQLYIDTDGDDNANLSATYAYDVRERLAGNGTYSVSVRNLDFEQLEFTIDGLLLVTTYENETAPATSYWIDEGCDVISSLPEKGLLPDDCETSYSFSGTVNMSTAGNASLYLVSTGRDQDNTTEHTVSFNEGTWYDIFDNQGDSMVMHLPVSTYLNETGNTADVQSTIRSQNSDYLVNRNAILIVQHQEANQSALTRNTSTSGQEQRAPSTDAIDSYPFMNESPGCQITLDSNPKGALVYVDDIYLGKTTPYTLEAKKGDYLTVRFELDGHVPSETSFIATNSTSIHRSLSATNAPGHTTKGWLQETPEDPDGIRYGGLFISSKPNGASISLDGISTGKTTPSVIMGLEPGSHTIKLVPQLQGPNDKNEIFFEDQAAWVLPGVLIPVDINGISYSQFFEIIIDSRAYRGLPFTVNGYPLNETVPAKVRTARFDSFVTVHENESFISYPIPPFLDEERYMLFASRDYQNFTISVNSDPRGADIFIDGFRTGYATPYSFGNISDGSHRIMVTKDGYLPKQSLIDLPWGSVLNSKKSIDFVLEDYPSGFLYVNSIPKGGKVTIDNLFTGEVTPAFFKSITMGKHSVKVTGTNTTKTFSDITITSLEMTNLTADFTPDEES